MPPAKSICIDANILIRAVLGNRVPRLLEKYSANTAFYTAEICFQDALKYLPIITKNTQDPHIVADAIEHLRNIVHAVDSHVYQPWEHEARTRIMRDPDDWPIVAISLMLDCPIWTEDQDFFGTGRAVWNTATVGYFLKA